MRSPGEAKAADLLPRHHHHYHHQTLWERRHQAGSGHFLHCCLHRHKQCTHSTEVTSWMPWPNSGACMCPPLLGCCCAAWRGPWIAAPLGEGLLVP